MHIDKRTVVGIVCAATCALCVFGYTQSVRGEADRIRDEALAKYGGDQVEVCVATRDISAGETLNAASIENKMWLVSMLPDQAVTSSRQVVGKQVTSPIVAGEVITSKRFGTLSSAFDVPSGMVAVSVSAKEVQAVGGALKPGSNVDIYSVGASGVSLIAQGVNVLATSTIDESGANSGSALSWVALAIKPDAVSDLIAAQEKTQLYFALPGESVSAASLDNASAVAEASSEAKSAAAPAKTLSKKE